MSSLGMHRCRGQVGVLHFWYRKPSLVGSVLSGASGGLLHSVEGLFFTQPTDDKQALCVCVCVHVCMLAVLVLETWKSANCKTKTLFLNWCIYAFSFCVVLPVPVVHGQKSWILTGNNLSNKTRQIYGAKIKEFLYDPLEHWGWVLA